MNATRMCSGTQENDTVWAETRDHSPLHHGCTFQAPLSESNRRPRPWSGKRVATTAGVRWWNYQIESRKQLLMRRVAVLHNQLRLERTWGERQHRIPSGTETYENTTVDDVSEVTPPFQTVDAARIVLGIHGLDGRGPFFENLPWVLLPWIGQSCRQHSLRHHTSRQLIELGNWRRNQRYLKSKSWPVMLLEGGVSLMRRLKHASVGKSTGLERVTNRRRHWKFQSNTSMQLHQTPWILESDEMSRRKSFASSSCQSFAFLDPSLFVSWSN